MATVREIVKEALLWRGVIDPENEPEDYDAKAGLRALIGLYQEDVVAKVPLQNIPVTTTTYTAGENERISHVSGAAVTVTLPQTIELDEAEELPDGSSTTIRKPRDRSVIAVSGAAPQAWLYDAALGEWIDILALTLTSEAPLSRTHRDGLIGRLTVLLRYPGVALDPVAVDAANGFRSDMTLRWDVERDPVPHCFY